jgi:hypothetical protein
MQASKDLEHYKKQKDEGEQKVKALAEHLEKLEEQAEVRQSRGFCQMSS